MFPEGIVENCQNFESNYRKKKKWLVSNFKKMFEKKRFFP